jgi:predicted dehydrogenase
MRLGVIGCGAVTEYFHLPALAALPEPGELWLVDPELERARSLATRVGARAAASHDGLELDAAIVAVPNHLHAEIATGLLERGVHVLCEKPLARSADEGRAVVAAAGNAVLAVGNFRRQFRSTRLVHDLLARNLCGAPVSFEAVEGFVYAWGTATGYSIDRERAGGGVLLDLGSHVLDQLRLWLGGLELRSYRDDSHDGLEADCLVELANGTLELSRTRELGSEVRIRCERGTIAAPLARSGVVSIELEGAEPYALEADGSVDGGYAAAFSAQLRQFLEAVEGRGAPAVGGADGVAVLELVDACYATREPLPEPWVTETLPL